jgi:hypothetical protein
MTEEREPPVIGEIKDILPILWSSYEHMYEVRETGTTTGINFLMIIATFLPIFCLTLYLAFTSPLFLFPILFQVAALLILLKRYFIQGQIPWLELKETLSQLDDNSFAVELLATLKAAETDTYMRLGALTTVIKRALVLLVFSIFLTALASLFMLLKGSVLLYVTTALLAIVFLLLCVFYKQVPRFDFANEQKNVKNDIEKWLKEHGKGKGDGSGPSPKSASPNK